jgi:hypothetical protein
MVMMGSPAVDNVSPFTIPETPRKVASSGYSTPKNYKSPNADMKDLTQKLHETSMIVALTPDDPRARPASLGSVTSRYS